MNEHHDVGSVNQSEERGTRTTEEWNESQERPPGAVHLPEYSEVERPPGAVHLPQYSGVSQSTGMGPTSNPLPKRRRRVEY
jgi:hypothetical protein